MSLGAIRDGPLTVNTLHIYSQLLPTSTEAHSVGRVCKERLKSATMSVMGQYRRLENAAIGQVLWHAACYYCSRSRSSPGHGRTGCRLYAMLNTQSARQPEPKHF